MLPCKTVAPIFIGIGLVVVAVVFETRETSTDDGVCYVNVHCPENYVTLTNLRNV